MQRYLVNDVLWKDARVVELKDRKTGARALIWPGFGCNLVWLRLAAPSGEVVELITPPEAPEMLSGQASRWGTPILFPWPGRIPGGRYLWRGETFQLAERDVAGNAIHGLVKDRPWRLEELSADGEKAWLRCRISSEDCGAGAEGFPFRWKLEVTYTLSGGGLELKAEVWNDGTEAMPFGFGAHPYFTVPFGGWGDMNRCLVQVPAGKKWVPERLKELLNEGGTAGLTVELSPEEDLRKPTPLGERTRDRILTDLEFRDGESVSSLRDPEAGLTLEVRAGKDFRSVILFAPAGRDAFCIEPWTCPPNAFTAEALGCEEAGVLVLEPGGRWEGVIGMRLVEEKTEGSQGG